jgi:heme exporter protein C
MPFFMFIMPRILSSLHPEPILNTQGKLHMNTMMFVVFLASLAGFTGVYWWMWRLQVRTEQLHHRIGP